MTTGAFEFLDSLQPQQLESSVPFTDTELDRVPYTTVFLNGLASARPFVFWIRGPLARPSYLTGSAVPSDHLPAGTMNTSIGSGAPLNCGFSMTGEWGTSAPQTAPSMSGV